MRDERGFSLVEVVLTTAIAGLIAGGAVTLFVSGQRAGTDLSERGQAQAELRLALDELRTDVHCASAAAGGATSVTLTVPATCVPQGSVTWCTSGSGTRHELFRLAGSGTCATDGRHYADWLTTGDVFTLHPSSFESLAMLRVDLRAQRAEMSGPLRVCDVLVLRNSPREGPTAPTPPSC